MADKNPGLARRKSTQPTKDPLYGWIPRRVSGEQVRTVLEDDSNPFTKQPHTPQYKKILEERKRLPIYAHMDSFFEMFTKNQITILIAETGSGKSTQIPQFVAFSDLPHARGKVVACTQPRRVAAISIAERVAQEMDFQLGCQVGYKTRFEDITEPGLTFIKYVTDDVLLHEAVMDPELTQYSTIIIDETHERSLATDLLIALLKRLVKRRPDLKFIIASASLDAGIKFQKYLGSSMPLLKVPGNTHPVEVFYIKGPVPEHLETAIRTVLMIHRAEDPGDILLFLTGREEVEEACRKIKLEADELLNNDPDSVGPLVCIPFYSTLPLAQQQRIFNPPPPRKSDEPEGRKVVISTDDLETSIAIPGIVYVVDPGFSKLRTYNPRIRVESSLASPISKASAQLRALCAGRTQPGKCFRLYTEKDFMTELEDQTYPGILRSNLATTVLQMLKLGVKDLVRFDYLDAPAPETLMRALELLNYLAALDDDGQLTDLGSMMAEFPLDPQLAKMLIISPEFKCSDDVLTIVSMLQVGNIWVRPHNARNDADTAKALLSVSNSDHLTLLNVYEKYQQNRHDKNWTRQHYLNPQALVQAEYIRLQLERIMQRYDLELISLSDQTQLFENIRKVLVCGFFMQVAHKGSKKGSLYTTKDSQIVGLHPSCGLNTTPEWVLYNEFVITSRPYIRTVTAVQVEWLLEYASNYFDPSIFPNGETKRALLRAQNKQTGKGNKKVPKSRKSRGPVKSDRKQHDTDGTVTKQQANPSH